MSHVLVLDASQRSALAVTRSLGKQGVSVLTAEDTTWALAGSSRYSKQYFKYPSPKDQPEQFINYLLDLCNQQSIHILFPMTELTSVLLLTHQSMFTNVQIPFADLESVNCLSDKCKLIAMAQKLGVPTPKTWYGDSPQSLSVDFDELTYPIVLKPGKSWLLQNNTWTRNSVRFASNPSQAKQIINNDPAFSAYRFMVQQCISGYGLGIFALYNQGKPVAFFSHRRLREKPPSGGASVLSESIPLDARALEYAQKILDAVHWHGVAMVEFKIDNIDHTPYLMEVNTRFWGSLQLSIDAGIDFPWLLYQVTTGASPAPVNTYSYGKRLRWLLGDFDHLYLVLRDPHYSFATKLSVIVRFLTPAPWRTRHEINRWADLGPFWFELKQYVSDLFS